jgi:hypothetical protein
VWFVEILFALLLAPALRQVALTDTFGPAAAESLATLGPATHGLSTALFLASDLTLCAAAGMVGADFVSIDPQR